VQKELEDIEAGILTMEAATIITSPAKQIAAERYKLYCPYSNGCKTPEKFFIRQDALVRHMKSCAADQGIKDNTNASANAWAKANMTLTRDRPTACPEWENFWEAAIWRIYHA